jgi:hypothetical protein
MSAVCAPLTFLAPSDAAAPDGQFNTMYATIIVFGELGALLR